jgi:hypothetical protein
MNIKSSAFLLFSLTATLPLIGADLDLSKLPPPSGKKDLTYARDIRPMLEETCFRCHGEERQRGDLRLDSLEALHKGSEHGKIVVPGKSVESSLVIAVSHLDDEKAMPPKPRPGGGGGRGGFGPGGMLAPQMVSQGDKDGDKKLSTSEFSALGDAWYDKLDAGKSGKLSSEQFADKLGEVLPAPQGRPGGGPGGGGRGFGPGRFVGPGLFTAVDADKDGSVTRAELKGVFAKWAVEWDADKTGALSEAQLRDGLSAALPRPNFGGAGGPGGPARQGGPGGPGGPGAPGGAGGGPGAGRGPGAGGGFGGPPAKPLTAEQVGLIRAWVDQGAK